MKYWNFGTLELWNLGTLEPWNSGTLELWNLGTLEPWNLGTLDLSIIEAPAQPELNDPFLNGVVRYHIIPALAPE